MHRETASKAYCTSTHVGGFGWPSLPHDIEREGLTAFQNLRYMDIIQAMLLPHGDHIDYAKQQVVEEFIANCSVLRDCGYCH